ncbi:MAG: hypothetical protein Q8N61_01560 [bacterium]|nr:hypothetical protein [bacterium]
MSKITYKLIVQPLSKMRYPTIGDYYKTKDGWVIASADSKNSDYNFLILLHEFIELYLTQRRGISEPKIKKFDEWFEREKAKGNFKGKVIAAGRHLKAPYRREHIFAEKIEKLLAKELGIDQRRQEKAEDELFDKVKKKFKNS